MDTTTRFHAQCAPIGAVETHDMDDARLRCAACGRTTYGVDWVVRRPMVAQPRPGTVRDQWGDPCARAKSESYPLRAKCENCGDPIRCADGTADWAHKFTSRGQCD